MSSIRTRLDRIEKEYAQMVHTAGVALCNWAVDLPQDDQYCFFRWALKWGFMPLHGADGWLDNYMPELLEMVGGCLECSAADEARAVEITKTIPGDLRAKLRAYNGGAEFEDTSNREPAYLAREGSGLIV